MSAAPAILIFDVGKTNKKILLFDEHYNVVLEESVHFGEIADEDGDPCEDLHQLAQWVLSSFEKITSDKRFSIKAVNFCTYGASFVYLDKNFKPILPLYNYLKPYPEKLKHLFYQTYGGESEFSRNTASPVLGSLNSGMQVYRIKHEKPEVFKSITCALHLPQYISFIITGRPSSEITSIGCHTNLWDFGKNEYADWVSREGILAKFPPLIPSDDCTTLKGSICVGPGLHDSSAALIPYLMNFHEPFILLSTGTWCISLNPFNDTPLTEKELAQDCLCYLDFHGRPVKASRLFAGHDHDQQVKRIAEWYNVPGSYFANLKYDPSFAERIAELTDNAPFINKEISQFQNPTEAYYHLLREIVARQLISTELVQKGAPAKRIFVDGGFSRNDIYMNMLASALPDLEVYAASVPQASALGAALAIHKKWNSTAISTHGVELKCYSTVSLKGLEA